MLAAADGSSPRLKKRAPLLGLRYRRALVPEGAVWRAAGVFRPLFWAPLLVALLAGLIALDAWIFFSHGVGGGLRSALYNPLLLLGLFGSVIVATAYHELGHATACRFGGPRRACSAPASTSSGPRSTATSPMPTGSAAPAACGPISAASTSTRSSRSQPGGLFAATGFEPLVLIVLTQHMIILRQLLPLLRFDGFYVVSDLTGVPDILSRVKPILASLIPRRAVSPRVEELKPWVRVVVTAYVIVLVPLLAFLLVTMIMGAPRMYATA